MTTTYCTEFASITVPKPRCTDTLRGGSGWYIVKYVDNSRTGGKQSRQHIAGPFSQGQADLYRLSASG